MKSLRECAIELIKNSIEADSTFIKISIFQRDKRRLILSVVDNGKGMTEEEILYCSSPFYSTKDKDCGMGIPLVKEYALRTGGDFAIDSIKNNGTTVSALFKPYNINMIPIGDFYSATLFLIRNFPDINFVLCQKTESCHITIDSRYSKQRN